MSSVLQEGVVPDRQDDVEHPLASEDHIDLPANIQDLISGPCRVQRARRDIQGCEGHRNLSEGAAFTQEVERQETALRLALDTLLLLWVKTEKPVDVVAVLNVKGDLERKDEQDPSQYQLYIRRRGLGLAGGNGQMDRLISDSEVGGRDHSYIYGISETTKARNI